ncbi:hypothetical protein [Ensifer sp. LCM 4579]|nr:hypothetical protein [Ensifer sp. LCM 4579]
MADLAPNSRQDSPWAHQHLLFRNDIIHQFPKSTSGGELRLFFSTRIV